MTFEEIELAIQRRMKAWESEVHPGIPVAFDNHDTPDSTRDSRSPSLSAAMAGKLPWLSLTIQHGDSITVGVGSRPCVRRTGLIIHQVFVDEHVSSIPAAKIADSLAVHFQYWSEGHLETMAASVQRVGVSNGWFQYNVSTPWRAG